MEKRGEVREGRDACWAVVVRMEMGWDDDGDGIKVIMETEMKVKIMKS